MFESQMSTTYMDCPSPLFYLVYFGTASVYFFFFFADDQISFPVMMKLNLIGLNCEKLVCENVGFKRWFLRTVHHFGKRVDVCGITNKPPG